MTRFGSKPAPAIDVGSSQITLALPGSGRVLREAALVAYSTRKRLENPPQAMPASVLRVLAVGDDALRPVPARERNVIVTRPLRGRRVTDPEALQLLVEALLRRAGLTRLRRWIAGGRVRLVLPSGMDSTERSRYEQPLRAVGLTRLMVVDAALAAVYGAGLDPRSPQGQMIFEIGAEHTCAVVVALGGVVHQRWSEFGGSQMDEALGRYLTQRYRLQLLPSTVEGIKREIGSVYPRPRPEQLVARGMDRSSGIEKTVTLDDNEVRDVLVDACEPLVLAVQQAFEGIPPELAGDIARSGVMLVGGGALLPGLCEFLGERTGLRFELAAEPQSAVSRGALVAG